MPELPRLRGERPPGRLVLVRLGRNTLTDAKLAETCEDAFRKWGFFGFSTLGLGAGGYPELARYAPVLPSREWVMEADTGGLLAAGFPVLPTAAEPHWTVVLSEPEPGQFARVRPLFSPPVKNPIWTGRR